MSPSETASVKDVPALPPFNLITTVEVLRRGRSNLAERLVDGEYRRVFTLSCGPRLIGVRQVAPDVVRVRAVVGTLPPEAGDEAVRVLTYMLGLNVDISPVWDRVGRVPSLAPLSAPLGGLKPPCFPSLWATLVNVIPFQQISLDAATAVLNRVVVALGQSVEAEGVVYYALPEPHAVLTAELEVLRNCGLGAVKARTLRHVAEVVASGELRDHDIGALDDAAALARLIQLPGIGPWSAQVVLLRGFRRLGVFPQRDSGALNGLHTLLDVPEPQFVGASEALLQAMGDYQGFLYFLLLGRKLLERGLLV